MDEGNSSFFRAESAFHVNGKVKAKFPLQRSKLKINPENFSGYRILSSSKIISLLVLLSVSMIFFPPFLDSSRSIPAVSAQTTPVPPIWPTIQHDFQRTSVGSSPGPTTNSTDWLYGPIGSIQSSPVIGSDGTIYLVDTSNHLYAMNPDGSVNWEESFNQGLFSPAIGPSGTVYVPGTRQLFAFYADGTPAWTSPYNITTDRDSALAISPQGIIYEVDSNGTLFAINPFGLVASTIWSLNTNCIPGTLALGPSGSIYCGTAANATGSFIESISPNGQFQWAYQTKSIVLVAPTVGPDGTIYVVSSGGEVFALSSEGALLWSIFNIHQEITSAVIGPNDTIYVAGDTLAAISQSGTELWSEFCYLTPSSLCFPFGTITSMAVDSAGVLYVGTNTSGLIALNYTGGLVWAYNNLPIGEGVLSPIAIGDNGTLYVGTGCLYCNVTTYGDLLAVGQPSGYSSFTVAESGLPSGNAWSFFVDGENYTTASNDLQFSLPSGNYSWVAPPSPLPETVGVRYAASMLQGNFSVPSNLSISLSFSIQYELNTTASPSSGGSVLPVSGQWYDPGSTVQLNGTAFYGYQFGEWSTTFGDDAAANMSSSQTSIQVSGPGSVSGEFDPLVTINSGYGGSILFLDPPYVGTLRPGQSISFYAPSESVLVLTAKPSQGYSFETWNSPSNIKIDSSSSVLEFKVVSPATLEAKFSSIPKVVSTSTSTTQMQSSTTTVSTSATVTMPHVPTSSALTTRNIALDLAGAIIIALAILLGLVVALGAGTIRRIKRT